MKVMRLFRLMKLFFIINLLVICSVKGDEVPFIFNYTESAEPGETIGLQGHGFDEKSKIWYALLNNEGTEVKPSKELMALTQSDIYIAVQIPEAEQTVMYGVLRFLLIRLALRQQNLTKLCLDVGLEFLGVI